MTEGFKYRHSWKIYIYDYNVYNVKVFIEDIVLLL